MMKGHTKIILTNVETGEQVVHEDDNLITKAIDKIINIEMSMNHRPNDRVLPIATNALGGIMLFDGELEESEDNIHFPTDVHLVGYGNGEVNTTDNKRGSFNAVESGKTENGYVSVWDFGTSQANGTIRAVARTHNHGGVCPIYNYNSPEAVDTNNGTPETDRDWYPIRYDGTYLYMLKGNSNTHQMRLARVKIPKMGFGVADYSDVARTYEVIASWDTTLTDYEYYTSQYWYDRRENIQTQTVYADSPYMYEDGGDGYIYCIGLGATNGWSQYQYDLTYFTINYGDESYEKSETVRKNTGLSFYNGWNASGFSWAGRAWGHVHNGNVYYMNSARKVVWIVPLDNVAAYQSVRVIQDSDSDYIARFEYIRPHNGGVYLLIYHYTSTGWNYRNGILYPDGVYVIVDYSYNGTSGVHGNSYLYDDRCRTCDDDLVVWLTGGSYYFRFSWAANYLGTINNLASPIEKTAAQTMKIIYTLTDVEG